MKVDLVFCGECAKKIKEWEYPMPKLDFCEKCEERFIGAVHKSFNEQGDNGKGGKETGKVVDINTQKKLMKSFIDSAEDALSTVFSGMDIEKPEENTDAEEFAAELLELDFPEFRKVTARQIQTLYEMNEALTRYVLGAIMSVATLRNRVAELED